MMLSLYRVALSRPLFMTAYFLKRGVSTVYPKLAKTATQALVSGLLISYVFTRLVGAPEDVHQQPGTP